MSGLIEKKVYFNMKSYETYRKRFCAHAWLRNIRTIVPYTNCLFRFLIIFFYLYNLGFNHINN